MPQGHLPQGQDNRPAPLRRQHLPEIRGRLVACPHRGIQANAQGREALGVRVSGFLPALSNYQRCHLWDIEQTFRALKGDGLKLPETQIQDAPRLFKLAALGLGAAVRTIQLVDARDGSPRPATDVADEATLEAAAAIGPSLEGRTARQKNPHPPRSLAWLAWIIARLGGWNCYYKPPGPKTMRAGWDRFAAMVAGYHVAKLLSPIGAAANV